MNAWTVISGVVGTVALTITIVLLIVGDVDKRVEQKIRDPEFIRKVALEIRLPTVIFDENDRILFDSGAMEYIEAIHINKHPEKGLTDISITPKKFMPIPPILTPLTDGISFHDPIRVGKLDWQYKSEVKSVLLLQGSGEKLPMKFRLEVIKQ
jgi:hypothetical protein